MFNFSPVDRLPFRIYSDSWSIIRNRRISQREFMAVLVFRRRIDQGQLPLLQRLKQPCIHFRLQHPAPIDASLVVTCRLRRIQPERFSRHEIIVIVQHGLKFRKLYRLLVLLAVIRIHFSDVKVVGRVEYGYFHGCMVPSLRFTDTAQMVSAFPVYGRPAASSKNTISSKPASRSSFSIDSTV